MANVIIFADNRNTRKLDNLGTDTKYSRPPRLVGSYRIATETRRLGLTCQVVEMMTDFSIDEIELVCKKYILRDTLIVGFNTTFWQDSVFDLTSRIRKIIDCTRDLNSKTKIIFGGPNGLDLVKNNNFDIDAVILGYGEHAFIGYLNNLIKSKALPFPSRMFNKVKIYDFVEQSTFFNFCQSQTIYDKSDHIMHDEVMVLEVGRGCIFKCKFCAYPLNGKKKLDYMKDPDILKDELIRNYEEFGINKYILSDDTFNDSNEKLDRLHKVFTTLPFQLYFSGYCRLDLINAHKYQIELLPEMGMRGAFFGIESFHEKAARTIGKGLSGDTAKKLLYDLKASHWKDLVKVQIGLIVGLPHETIESYQETENWILNEDKCLVEKVITSILALRNPKYINSPWVSEFEKNPEKYGFYWPIEQNRDLWFNDQSPIKNKIKAIKIDKTLSNAIKKAVRYNQGGFSMFSNYNRSHFFKNKKSFEDQIKMNRFEYNQWVSVEYQSSLFDYTNHYKTKILNS